MQQFDKALDSISQLTPNEILKLSMYVPIIAEQKLCYQKIIEFNTKKEENNART